MSRFKMNAQRLPEGRNEYGDTNAVQSYLLATVMNNIIVGQHKVILFLLLVVLGSFCDVLILLPYRSVRNVTKYNFSFLKMNRCVHTATIFFVLFVETLPK